MGLELMTKTSLPFRLAGSGWITALALVVLPQCAVAQLPSVEVLSTRRIFHNGEHNAFTDLCRFRNEIYLAFRSCPDGHMVHPTSSILILASSDGKQWRQVHQFSVPQRDTRDPHFLVFQDKLFLYTGTWFSGKTSLAREDYDLNKHLAMPLGQPMGKIGTALSCWKEL